MSADSLVTPGRGPAATTGRPVRRLIACAAAVLAAVLVWVLATVVAGAELPANGAPVTWWMFAAATLAASLAGWAVLEVLERRLSQGRRWWLVLAGVVLLASLLGPLGTPDLSGETRLWLTLSHLVVAAVLVVGLLRPARR